MPRNSREEILRKVQQAENLCDNILGHFADCIAAYTEAEAFYQKSYAEYKEMFELAAQGIIVVQDLLVSMREEKL